MARRIVLDWPAVTAWVLERSHALVSLQDCVSIGVVEGSLDDRRVLGGVIFHNNTGRGGAITVHMAGNETSWASRELLWAIFDYAFNQMGVEKVIGLLQSDNARAIDVDLRLGFVPEAKVKGAFPDADLLILTMTRAQCRWLSYVPKALKAGPAGLAFLSPY